MSQSLKATAKGSKSTQRRKERTLLSDAQIIIALHPPPSCNPALKLKFLRLKELIQDNKDLCATKTKKGLARIFLSSFAFLGSFDFKDNIIEIHI